MAEKLSERMEKIVNKWNNEKLYEKGYDLINKLEEDIGIIENSSMTKTQQEKWLSNFPTPQQLTFFIETIYEDTQEKVFDIVDDLSDDFDILLEDEALAGATAIEAILEGDGEWLIQRIKEIEEEHTSK